MVLISLGLFACAEHPEGPIQPASDASGSPAGMTTQSAAADLLQDCLARIPKDATSGQRDIAERTCQRDAAERATTTRGETASSGTSGDTLQACMARIPKDATAGQRMIAEESCQRDEANRRSVQAVPGR
jgi:hypothetical protein